MSSLSPKIRLATAVFVGVFLLAGAGAMVTRWTMLPWALGAALRAGGATDVTFAVERASPWRLQVVDLGFNFDAIKFDAGSVLLERSHWWTFSLGKLSVTEARVEVDLDRLAAGASEPATAAPASLPTRIPLEEFSIDGQVILHAGTELNQALVVRFAAHPAEAGTWRADLKATAPGLELGVAASYAPAGQKIDFKTTALRLELQPWQSWLEHWAPLPSGPWVLAGALTGTAAGSYHDGRFAAQGGFQLREARVESTGLGLAAEGVEADIEVADFTQPLASKATLRARTVTSGEFVGTDVAGEFQGTASGRSDAEGKSIAQGGLQLQAARVENAGMGLAAEVVAADIKVDDLDQLLASKGTLRVKTVTSGKIVLTDVATEFSERESGRFEVAALSARALGGTVNVEPFVYRLGEMSVEAVVSVEDIQADQVMALTQDLPARASGSLSGRLPLKYDEDGVRLGTGWLGLKAGATAEIQFHANGLLTAGTSPKSPSYAVLKKVEDGILKLKVTELRLDIRPPNAPAGRTAQLHVVGAPVDPQVKAPVTLDLNVNGPIESLLNLGMKSGASFGTKP